MRASSPSRRDAWFGASAVFERGRRVCAVGLVAVAALTGACGGDEASSCTADAPCETTLDADGCVRASPGAHVWLTVPVPGPAIHVGARDPSGQGVRLHGVRLTDGRTVAAAGWRTPVPAGFARDQAFAAGVFPSIPGEATGGNVAAVHAETVSGSLCVLLSNDVVLGNELHTRWTLVGFESGDRDDPASHPGLVGLAEGVAAVFAAADIAVRVDAIASVDPSVGVRLRLVGSAADVAELAELATAAHGGPSSAIDVALVRGMVVDEASLAGFSPAVPGHPFLSGTRVGAVVVAVGALDIADPDRADVDRIAATLAHELGHGLGLFHTSAGPDGAPDPLTDTPECPPERWSDACPDAGNLMWPFATDPPARAITEQQAWVLRRHPSVVGGAGD